MSEVLADGGFGLLPLTEVDPAQLKLFDCGTLHLNEFLSSQAQPLHTNRLGFTSVVFHTDFDGPVGYFTLANDAIPLTASELFAMDIDEMQFPLKSFPAVKIGRLAVTTQLQSNGVGASIMRLLLGEVLDAAYLSSARILVVDADNKPRVVQFYERQGFERSAWAEKAALHHTKKGGASTVKMLRDIMT